MRRLALLSVLLLAACAAGPSTGSSTSSTAALPDGWQLFQSEKFGYSLGLPSGWSAVETDSSLAYKGGTPPAVLFAFRGAEKFSSLEAGLKARDAAAATAWEGKPSIQVKSSRNITINGAAAVEREEEYLAAGLTARATYFLHDGQLYVFTMRPDDAVALPNEQIELHRQVMGTLRWL